MTLLGGVAVFRSFRGKIGLGGKIRQPVVVRWRSPDRISPTTLPGM